MKELKEKLIEIFEKNLETGLRISATTYNLIGKKGPYDCHYITIDNNMTSGILKNVNNDIDNYIFFNSKERVMEELTYGEYNRLLKLHHAQHNKEFNERQEKEKVERVKNHQQTLKDINKLCK